jgi:hypothetical protein
MASTVRPFPATVHLPLRRVALCLDCDECFELGFGRCPACGSGTWTALGRFLEGRIREDAAEDLPVASGRHAA